MAVAAPLTSGDLTTAREKVGMIVGRDPRNLDEAGVTRAAVETVAENLVDGFLAPLFWAVILGVPGAVAYKMVNTLDSMVGYQTIGICCSAAHRPGWTMRSITFRPDCRCW